MLNAFPVVVGAAELGLAASAVRSTAVVVTALEWLAAEVIDSVMEDVRLGMEINKHKHNQRRIAMVKFLAEMYNYRLIDSSLIFKVLSGPCP